MIYSFNKKPLQTPGQSTLETMSQKAVTDGLGTKADLINGKVPSDQLRQVPPIAKVKVVIPEGGATLSSYCDDSSYFPNYIPADWNDDYSAFLASLGTFKVDWGDGTFNYFSYLNDGLNGNGFLHEYTTDGTFIITWHSPYVFLQSELITEVIKLQGLQNLYLFNCTSLKTPPNLTGLIALQVLYLGGCTSLTTPPDLTGLIALQNLQLYNCTSLKAADLDTILTYLSVLHTNLQYVDLRNGKTPTLAVKNAAKEANPQCQIYTN
jgi:hypothetical protein